MKHFFLTAALTCAFFISQAQNRKQDSSRAMPHGIPSRTDSVKNGQEVISGNGAKSDTLSKGHSTHSPKKNPSKSHHDSKGTAVPNHTISSQKTSTVSTQPKP